ncbi:MAG: isocitrate lyase/phosphoenolpyruvate mutase family protein [Kofleriaceae bacterium]
MSTTVTTFRSLHAPATLLVLPNAWDVGSARLFEAAGAPAVATTSAGVAWANGYRDGNQMPVSAVHALAQGLMRVIRVPVSVDFEAGYSTEPKVVAENVKPLLELGIAGINIEDGRDAPEVLERKIAAIRDVVAQGGTDLFINARTDVYLQGLVSADNQMAETLERAKRYRAAGADGVFIPALANASAIKEICSSVGVPINVLAWAGIPLLEQLKTLGVSRLSAGSSMTQVLWARAETLAQDFMRTGDSTALRTGVKTHGELQRLFPDT